MRGQREREEKGGVEKEEEEERQREREEKGGVEKDEEEERQREREEKGGVEKEEEEEDVGGDSSLCPSCGRGFDMPLLLPCSHTLCGRCVSRGAGSDRSVAGVRGVSRDSRPIVTVLCPHCRYGVELPCWEWASASRCLPRNPTVNPDPAVTPPSRGHAREREEEWSARDTDQMSACGGAVDLSEAEMEQSVSGLLFSLDPSTAAPPLYLSNSDLTVTFRGHAHSRNQGYLASPQPTPLCYYGDPAGDCEPCDSSPLFQVCAGVVVCRGQYYWEVDVCNSALYGIGVSSLAGDAGWWLERRGLLFWAVFDGRREPLPSVPPHLKTVGVFLNMGGASITFHNSVTQELLLAVASRLAPALRPALRLGQGRLRLRPGLPPPNHVFLSRSSAYRRAGGSGPGSWRRDVAFQSVRSVIQKFEEMSV